MSESLDVYAHILRTAGWTVTPPVDPKAAIPAAEVGQVWVSPKPRVEPRTVMKVGRHNRYSWSGENCVYFTKPSDPEDRTWPRVLPAESWLAWVRKSGARPQLEVKK